MVARLTLDQLIKVRILVSQFLRSGAGADSFLRESPARDIIAADFQGDDQRAFQNALDV